jgi:hypothetical protein
MKTERYFTDREISLIALSFIAGGIFGIFAFAIILKNGWSIL